MSLIFNAVSVGSNNCLLMSLLIVVGNFSSCISDDVSRSDIFSFKVNGRLVKAADNDLKSGSPTICFIKADTILHVAGTNSIEQYDGISLRINNFSGIGKYTLSESFNNIGTYGNGSNRYTTDNTYHGTVTIKHIVDTPPRRISGTFSFSVLDDVSGEIIQISDGHFNLPCGTIE